MKKYLLLCLIFAAPQLVAQTTPLENSFVAAINSGNTLEVGRLLAQNPRLGEMRIGINQYTPLYLAVMRGNYDVVKKISSINKELVHWKGNKNNMSPISLAASIGRDNLVEVMWESNEDKYNILMRREDTNYRSLLHWISSQPTKADLLTKIYKADSTGFTDNKDAQGKTPLDYLADRGIKNIPKELAQDLLSKDYGTKGDKKKLLQTGISYWSLPTIIGIAKVYPELLGEIKNSREETALHWAIENRLSPALIRDLVEQNPQQLSEAANTAKYLRLAARSGQTEAALYLAQKNPALLLSSDPYLPAHEAALSDNYETAIALLKLEPKALHQLHSTDEKTFLHIAAKKSSANLINYVSDIAPAQVMAKDSKDNTPLHIAADENNIEAARALAQRNLPSLEALNRNRDSPIIVAMRKGNIGLAIELIGLKPELFESLKIGGDHITKYCVASYPLRVCLPLLKIDPKLMKMPMGTTTALHRAAGRTGDPYIASEIAKLLPENLLALNEESRTPLHLAAISGLLQSKELAPLEPKALLSIDKNGDTPLMAAMKFNQMETQMETVSYLANLEPKALIKTDNDGNTPLHVAAREGMKSTVELLVKLEPKALEIKNNAGQSPLHLAAIQGNVEIIKLLSKLSPNMVTTKDKENCLPLHYAASSSDRTGAGAEYLASLSPETLEATDSKGCNVLHLAARSKDEGRLKVLSKLYPENLKAKNLEGKTPLEQQAANTAHQDNLGELQRLHRIFSPDSRVTDGKSPPTRTIPFETNPLDDPLFPTAKDNKLAKDLSDFLNKFNLSRLKHSLLLALSNCSTGLRFTHHQIPTERAINSLEAKGRKNATTLDWESLSLSERMEKISQLFEIDSQKLASLNEKLNSLQKDPSFSNVKNRFLLLSGKYLTDQSEVKNVCSELSKRAKSEIESHLGGLWVEAKEKDGDQAKIPILAELLSVTDAELGTYSHTEKFLDEDLIGEKRDALAPVVSHCVDCHNPQAKDVDYPLSFKKVDLDRAPDSPKSKERTLRAETLRRLDLPPTDPAKMPKGGDHQLSPDQTKALKDFLLQETPTPRAKD